MKQTDMMNTFKLVKKAQAVNPFNPPSDGDQAVISYQPIFGGNEEVDLDPKKVNFKCPTESDGLKIGGKSAKAFQLKSNL